jgi:hypothetical protein
MSLKLSKNKKLKKYSGNKSIDQLHDEKLFYFKKLEKSLPAKRKLLNSLIKPMKIIDNYVEIPHMYIITAKNKLVKYMDNDRRIIRDGGYLLSNGIHSKTKKDIISLKKKSGGILTIDIVKNIFYLEKDTSQYNYIIKMIEDEIEDILSKKEENEYFLAISEIIYNLLEKNINDHGEDKKELTIEYYKRCNLHYIKTDMGIKFDYCKLCSGDYIISNDGMYTCRECGYTSSVLINGFSYKDRQEMDISNKFIYKRINYFTETINQIQANENIKLPDELVDKIKKELCKRNIRDSSKLKPYLLKKILKEIGESKYYENINLIISKLCNKKPLVIPVNIVDKLKEMFLAIQKPFERLKGDRTNFFSYPYILYKFCELLDLTEYLQYFQLLKSREKLNKQDAMWKKVIEDVRETDELGIWRYIPSC